MSCIRCKKKEETADKVFPFHVLEVQTLPIRDMGGVKRVQALGRFQDFCVCEACAGEKLEEIRSFRKSVLFRCIPFCGIFLLGIVISVLLRSAAVPLRLLGVAAIACGILGVFDQARNGIRHRREFQTMSNEEAMEAAAWEVLVQNAPKKSEDSDLTYIPVNKKTLKMKNGDLMNMFDLLPEIAVKAYDMIRKEK